MRIAIYGSSSILKKVTPNGFGILRKTTPSRHLRKVKMKIEIWSDIACPFCAIGKKRFEKALTKFDHRAAVEIEWKSFELNPAADAHYEGTLNEWLVEKKHISMAQAQAMNAQVSELAAKEGLEFNLDHAIPTNTFEAHRLTHFAALHNKREAMTEILFKAYFGEGENLSEVETLGKLAGRAGLDVDEAMDMLRGSDYSESVRSEEERAKKLGIQGVPFFLLNGEYGISGAQATETFLDALNQLHALESEAGFSSKR